MSWFQTDLFWPVAGAIVAGALIGLEREYRGSPAGFRTHILVSLASALLMLAAVHQIRWLTDTPLEVIRIDPVRMAHGVLTGIGFILAGAIFREGFTIRGLTTAASLWVTAALGMLFGVGFYGLAIGGTAATVVVLAAVSLTEGLLPNRRFLDVAVRYRRDSGATERHFRQVLADHGMKPEAVAFTLEPDFVAFSAVFEGARRPDTEGLAAALSADPAVLAVELKPRLT